MLSISQEGGCGDVWSVSQLLFPDSYDRMRGDGIKLHEEMVRLGVRKNSIEH